MKLCANSQNGRDCFKLHKIHGIPPLMHTNKQVQKLSVSERAKWYGVKKVDVNSGAKHSNAKKMVLEMRKRKAEAESSSESSSEEDA